MCKELFTFFVFSLLCRNIRIMTVVKFPHFQPSSVDWTLWFCMFGSPSLKHWESAALRKPTWLHLASPGPGKSEELDHANTLSLKHLSDSEACWFEPAGLSVSRDVTSDWV